VNGAKVTDTSKQIIYNSQKTNMNASWKEVTGKKKGKEKAEQSRNLNAS